MRGAFALALFVLAVLFGLTHYDPNASHRFLIDAQPAPNLHRTSGPNQLFEVCESRALRGPAHTLNPHAPPERRRQELIKVCVEVLSNGQLPPPPFIVNTVRKPVTIT